MAKYINFLGAVIVAIGFALLLSIQEPVAFADTIPNNNEPISQSNVNYLHVGSVGLPFIKNNGQVDDHVLYYANTFAGTAFVTKDSITYSLQKSTLQEDANIQGIAIKEKFLGGQTLNPTGIQKSQSTVNYFVGDRTNWQSNVPAYETLSLGQIWPSINVSLKAHGNNIEKIFTVHRGGNVNDIKVETYGVTDLQTGTDGRLVLGTQLGSVSMTEPAAYQFVDGVKNAVQVSYCVNGTTYGFTVGNYDHNYDLIIDPLLASTFIGGGDDDFSRAMVIDSGKVYVAGYTQSSNFPITAGAYNKTYGGNGLPDLFISKLDSSLSTLLASTYLGGSGLDFLYGMTVDSSHNVYVTGRTESPNFPVTSGAYDTTFHGVSDVYVSKLDSSLSTLLASTYLGGNDFDNARTIIINGGNVYIAGRTYSNDYPTTMGAYDRIFNGNHINGDAFISELNPSLTTLLASTYVGGSNDDIAYWMINDSSNNIYISGQTDSTDFPTTGTGYSKILKGQYDVFISKLNPSLSTLLASTYLGGNGFDLARELALDSSGNLYVVGDSNSTNFPTTAGAYHRKYSGAGPVPNSGDGGSGDVFISKLNPSLSTLLASTYLGGVQNDLGFVMSIDSGSIYVAGTTLSTNFPVTGNAYDTTFNADGGPDAFISKLDSSLSTLLASTYLGGNMDDAVRAMVVDSNHTVYVTGPTNSPDFPVTSGKYDNTYNGNYDTFISKLDSCLSSSSTNPISITIVNNTSPRWGVDKVLVAGSSFNAPSGYTVTVKWGDGTRTKNIPISCGGWGPVFHTYASTATSSNPNHLSANLLNNTNSTVATNTPILITVQPHSTSISLLTTNSPSVKWGKNYNITNSLLTDLISGLPIGGQTLTYSGNGTTGSPSDITNSSGMITKPITIKAPGIFNVGPGNIFATFAGNSAYQPSTAFTTISITPHLTTLSTPVLNLTTIKWGKSFTAYSILKDKDNSGTPIANELVNFVGNGVITKSDYTNDTGAIQMTLIASNSTGTGKQVNASFGGEPNYLPTSSSTTITIARHATGLALGTIKNTPWGTPPSFPATLTDVDNGGLPVANKTIHFNGTGVIGVLDKLTNGSGTALGSGTAPLTVATGWQVQAHFAVDNLYLKKDSIIKSYSTLAHGTTLNLSVIPSTVIHGSIYKVSGTLKDTVTGQFLSSKTITFTADFPIVISNTTTDSSGAYVVTGLIAPITPGTYHITSHFAGSSQYLSKDSLTKTLTVT